jgi:anion-transporting  ArsA/GET3 family ATPase
VAVTRGHGEVKALAIDVEEALLDYLDMFYNLRRAGRALRKMGAIDFATAIAPGLRDVLITGKIKEAVTRRHEGRPVYDAVVVDAPPTGRITRFLGVTAEMSQLARSGPIKTQSDGVMAVLRSPQTAVHLVTLLEDMPVQETADAIAELTEAKLPVGSAIVNMATEPVLPVDSLARAAEGRFTGADLAPALAAAHLPGDGGVADALAAQVVEHAQRWASQDALRHQVEALGRPTVELPLLAGPMDIGSLFELAARLEEHLRTTTVAA